MRRLMIIAGEASGDLHAGKVVRELRNLSPDIEVFGVGGEHMRNSGVDIIYDISGISFVGFIDVIRDYRKIRELSEVCKAELIRRRPDAVLLVDYPGFNLRFAGFARRNNFRVFYYIAPQVWAWGRGRIRSLKRFVDKIFVIFQFEERFFRRYGIDAEFVGHPLLEDILLIPKISRHEFSKRYGLDGGRKIISFFPGSRVQEVKLIFPVMVDVSKMLLDKFSDVEPVFGVARTVPVDIYDDVVCGDISELKFIDESHILLKFSHIAVVKSGTITLESAILGVPMVICYRTSFFNYILGKILIEREIARGIGLVNIVARMEGLSGGAAQIVPELIQGECRADRIFSEVERLMMDREFYYGVIDKLDKVRAKLGSVGASKKVAERVIQLCG
jgi:lipid-A-disaccharide synthase